MKNKFKSLMAAALMVIGLGGCGNKNLSSSEPVNQSSISSEVGGFVGENNYYNEENFIKHCSNNSNRSFNASSNKWAKR